MLRNINVDSSTELFKTSKGATYQCDSSNRIILQFEDTTLLFRIQDFLVFKRLINQVDIRSKLFDLSDECDYEVVEAPQVNFSKRLTLCELIQLRELINATYFAIELNSMLAQILYTPNELV